jgi:hypothetical protein
VRDARVGREPAPLTEPVPRPPRRVSARVWLVLIFVAAAAYHAVQGTLHVTPAVFTDELLHSKLAQAFADGNPFEIRGEHVFFPAFLPALLQAPAWLAGDTETAYAIVKAVNAIVMSAAVFPVYWLARRLVRPSFALLAAAAAVAAPALLYDAYLLSEPLAYPVFVTAFAVLVRALDAPSARWGLAAIAVSAVAVGTRVQFVALPLVFAALVAARPRELRRHTVPALGLVALVAAALVGGTALLGTYSGLTLLDYDPWQVIRWSGWTAALLPFAAGLVIVPGAILGLSLGAARPRSRTEAAFARLALGVGALFVLQAGLIAAGESQRPLERYVIYLAPLATIAFFAYAERGAPLRRLYAGLALGLGLAAWLVPFPSLADYRFSFDSPVLSAYGTIASVIGAANAATIFAAVPLAVAVVVAFRPLTIRTAHALGLACVCLLVAGGAVAYAGDHGMTARARAAWTASPPDWLDAGGYGRADFLGLPGGSPHFAWSLEAWNRHFGRPIWLAGDAPPHDPWAAGKAGIDGAGTLLVDGRPAAAGLLVVNDFGTQIDLEGETLANPHGGLRLVRIPASPRVTSLARGLFFDGWANGDLRFRVWPGGSDGGVYRVRVSLPRGFPARPVTFAVEGGASRTVLLEPERSVSVELPADDAAQALRVSSPRAELLDGRTANPRLVSFRVDRLEFVAAPPVSF